MDRNEKDSFAKKVNEAYMVPTPWGYTKRSNVKDISDFDAKNEEEQYLISLPQDTRVRLEGDMKKHVEGCGKEMKLDRMRAFVNSYLLK